MNETLSNLIFARKLLNPNATTEYLFKHIGHMFTMEEIKEELERE